MNPLEELEKLGDLKYTDLFWPYYKQLKKAAHESK